MNTKLTLNLDKEIIHEAKAYAKNHSVSLSKLIENYLNSLTRTSQALHLFQHLFALPSFECVGTL